MRGTMKDAGIDSENTIQRKRRLKKYIQHVVCKKIEPLEPLEHVKK